MKTQTIEILNAVLQSDRTIPDIARERLFASIAGGYTADLPREWIGETEAAQALGLSKSALQQWRRNGTHPKAGKFPFTILETPMNTYCYDPGEIADYNRRRLTKPGKQTTNTKQKEN